MHDSIEPTKRPAPLSMQPAAQRPPDPEAEKRKILVIDDDPYVRDFLRRTLERAGFAVTLAADGRKAMRLYAALKPDCVIADLLMPDQDGIETIIELRRHAHRTRIVAISGGFHTMATVFLKTARVLGADVVLSKPFSVERLLEAVGPLGRAKESAADAGQVEAPGA